MQVVEKNNKARNSNLELYRIIVMLLIVAHHYVVNDYGLWTKMSESPFTFNSSFYYILGMWGKTGINCFVMITGYFMCTSKITLTKFMKLYLQIVFYSIIALGVSTVFYGKFSTINLLWCFCPIKGISTNFMGCFIIFYLLIPFLNIVFENISKKMHVMLIALLLFSYVIMPLQTKYDVFMNYISWFITLYFISSFIRRYSIWKEDNSKIWAGLTLLSIGLSIVSVLLIVHITQGAHAYYLVGEVNRPFALLTGIASFVFFKGVNIRQNKFINIVAASTFGVFLLHTRLSKFLWKDMINVQQYYVAPIVSVLIIFAVYVICTLIDFIRIKLIEKPLFSALRNRNVL